MRTILPDPQPPGKPGGPVADHSFITLVVPADGPVAAFHRLVTALDAGDFRAATAIRREMYRLGWSIIAPATWRGGRP